MEPSALLQNSRVWRSLQSLLPLDCRVLAVGMLAGDAAGVQEERVRHRQGSQPLKAPANLQCLLCSSLSSSIHASSMLPAAF